MNRRAVLGLLGSTDSFRYLRHARTYQRLNGRPQFAIRLTELFPVVRDFRDEAGSVRDHYFHQDLWAARLVYERRPRTHMDIGSRIDGFVAHLLTFMDVTVVDIRPLRTDVPGLTFIQADATTLAGVDDDSVDSLSSLHAIEHFGLGRYGDPIDPDGPFEAINAMTRVLAPQGRLYLSVPIGRERLQFNAHRIFDPLTIMNACRLRLNSFAAVDDSGRLHSGADPEAFRDATYSCGLFEFVKGG